MLLRNLASASFQNYWKSWIIFQNNPSGRFWIIAAHVSYHIWQFWDFNISHWGFTLCPNSGDLKQRVKYHKFCIVQACYFSVFLYIFKGQKIHESNFSNDLWIPLNFRFVNWTYLVGLLRWWNLQIVILSLNFEWILGRHVGFEKGPGAIFSDPPMLIYGYASLWVPGP